MQLSTVIATAALVSATLTAAAPFERRHFKPDWSCDAGKARLSLPSSSQSTMSSPSGAPKLITLGVGVQNYTCTNGTYASAGAVASLFDISCLYGTPFFDSVGEEVYQFTSRIDESKLEDIFDKFGVKPMLDHFFTTLPGANSTNPEFARTADGGSTNVVAKKAAAIDSPDGSCNVQWLQLSNVEGSLAKTVYRVDTVQGQPPSSCDSSNTFTLSVPYTAKYWFFD